MKGSRQFIQCKFPGCNSKYVRQEKLDKHYANIHGNIAPIVDLVSPPITEQAPATLECSICLESISLSPQGVCLPCRHGGFHYACVSQILNSSSCPICKGKIEEVIKVFL